ncbi:hypothetical protein EKH57_02410 [Halorubrum sp. BOL3-1]|uniref:hypothetical protein n=1 Tax=Halorubrum sp. BOL3-1 TaxID=2497325 RepID=UPI0010050FDA|nr:hypothetical protein [Halorubrum sp. BOL3-1]QAU11704.1 hypothetical protein EKH57_02410 [Halorubrum sp. BOL3-1]
MAAAIHTPSVEATVAVRVSQAAAGDLAAGAEAQLERVDGVRVEELEIAGLQPGLNDTTVEAVAVLAVESGVVEDAAVNPETVAPELVSDRLAGGFGVDPERVERVDPPD